MKYRKVVISLFLAVMPLLATAQQLPVVNKSLKATAVNAFSFPGRLDGLWFRDGVLHASVEAMLLAVKPMGDNLLAPEVDSVAASICPDMTYMTVNPATNTVFYTKSDSRGRSRMFEYYEKKPGKFTGRRVKPQGFSYTIEHPVFSPDGHAVVFASDCPLGFGGRDLWYSEWRDDEWQYPQNLGHRINTSGDEVMPSMYGDFLVFASNGRDDALGGFDLYASRLVALEQTGDTVSMYPIGRSAVTPLYAPLSTPHDDLFFTLDAAGDQGWVVRCDTATGNSTVVHFGGRLDCVMMKGRVTDSRQRPLGGVAITVRQPDVQAEAVYSSAADGSYVVFLQPDREATIRFAKADYFSEQVAMLASRVADNDLYSRDIRDVVLLSYPLDSTFAYPDMFSTSVGSELSPSGRQHMERLALFLSENPHIKVRIVSAYNFGTDMPFCALVNGSRQRVLSEYLVSLGVPASQIVQPSPDQTRPRRTGPVVSHSSTGSPVEQSSLTVSFTLVK